ncbi:MAG: 4-hydroxybenzoate octaprenyltransferase [Alphaproteobacteria bacterium]|nr:4-hydroxybenzoate octaprenyltransferase [Alphaproteobacteria bacterium]
MHGAPKVTKPHTDIKRIIWIERILPKSLLPYVALARLDRPVGIWLLLLPGWWSITLASGGIANMKLWEWTVLALFGIGAILMRAAGCVINDIWDRDLDRQVERTRSRPLAAGTLSLKQASVFLATLLLISLVILLQFNKTTIILGIATLPLIATYPLMKRFTWWPQAFLGLTFNFGALMGWSAINGSITLPALFLYISGIFWTIGYDTIYAHQDKEDDALAGIKSTALKFGANSKYWVAHFYAFSLITMLIATMLLNSESSLKSGLFLIPAAAHLIWQLKTWTPDNPESSLKTFKSNRDFALLALLAFCLI